MKTALLILAIGLVGALPVDKTSGVKGGAANVEQPDTGFDEPSVITNDFQPMESRAIKPVQPVQPVQPLVATVQPVQTYNPHLQTVQGLAPWPNVGYANPTGWTYGYQNGVPYGGHQFVGNQYGGQGYLGPQYLPNQPQILPVAAAPVAPINTSGAHPVIASRLQQPTMSNQGLTSMTNPKLDNAGIVNGSNQPIGYLAPAMQPWVHPPIPMRAVAGLHTATTGTVQPIISPMSGFNGMNANTMTGRFTGSLLGLTSPGAVGGYIGGGGPYYNGNGPYYGGGGSHYGGGGVGGPFYGGGAYGGPFYGNGADYGYGDPYRGGYN